MKTPKQSRVGSILGKLIKLIKNQNSLGDIRRTTYRAQFIVSLFSNSRFKLTGRLFKFNAPVQLAVVGDTDPRSLFDVSISDSLKSVN